jgi:alkylated DNA repair dioxygenase AlkB
LRAVFGGRIHALSGFKFNFAVGNRYLTGKDSIGWHSDDFPQIGKRPAIASLSLGSTRKFKLRHKDSGQTVDYQLESGSLLIMLPGCQEDWVQLVQKGHPVTVISSNPEKQTDIEAVGATAAIGSLKWVATI